MPLLYRGLPQGGVVKSENAYSFGDGSLNTIPNGYNDNNLCIDNKPASVVWGKIDSNNLNLGNNLYNTINAGLPSALTVTLHTAYSATHSKQAIYAGTNTITFLQSVMGNTGTVKVETFGGAYTHSSSISNFQLYINNAYYTLEQSVTNKLIKPLVLISSPNNTYFHSDSISIYSGGDSGVGSFAELVIFFMVNDNNRLNGLRFHSTATYDLSYNDGLSCFLYCDSYLHLKEG